MEKLNTILRLSNVCFYPEFVKCVSCAAWRWDNLLDDKDAVLQLRENLQMIGTCNPRCPCDRTRCPLHLLRHKVRRKRLYKHPKKGAVLVGKQDMLPGMFIGQYQGEVRFSRLNFFKTFGI